MPLYSFFDAHDFNGKTVIPFSSHGGSGFSETISEIARLEPSANVLNNGLTISRGNVAGSANDITAWLERIGY